MKTKVVLLLICPLFYIPFNCVAAQEVIIHPVHPDDGIVIRNSGVMGEMELGDEKETIEQFDVSPETWERLIVATRDSSPTVRMTAVKAASGMPELSGKAVDAIRECMRDEDGAVSKAAFDVLIKRIEDPQRLGEIIVAELRDGTAGGRELARAWLVQNPEVSLPLVCEMLQSNMVSEESKRVGLEVVGGFGKKGKEAAPVLAEFLTDDNSLRNVSLVSLAQIRNHEPEILDSVTNLIGHENELTRMFAVGTLGVLVNQSESSEMPGEFTIMLDALNTAKNYYTTYDTNGDRKLSADDEPKAQNFLKRMDSDGNGVATEMEVYVYCRSLAEKRYIQAQARARAQSQAQSQIPIPMPSPYAAPAFN